MKDKQVLTIIQNELQKRFGNISLKGKGDSSFLYLMVQAKAVEISLHEDGLWLEFWDLRQDASAAPCREMTVPDSRSAVEETIKWLGDANV